ncbi:hypothetical protein [Haloplanus aerogenes]|uniref:Uncharacterized protein n=1 Tax=Haloplanus aerogenes TaxID=660522 RepID=A0A3M0DRZ0_9EURY|nr:hypothetical protein [Haloplanus aerogenes]AZH24227.1 hypothetical protein DU502_02045 [Haloplanus aerogenes]RMB24145.1 hypothetical protein ATH50_1385 [Haloplanus aerogenes]
MDRLTPVYASALLALTLGVAALLVGEFFDGADFLVPLGGATALVAVGALAAAIGWESPPSEPSEH